jgi:hypothetical protein
MFHLVAPRFTLLASITLVLAAASSLRAQTTQGIPSDPSSAYDQATTVPADPKATNHYVAPDVPNGWINWTAYEGKYFSYKLGIVAIFDYDAFWQNSNNLDQVAVNAINGIPVPSVSPSEESLDRSFPSNTFSAWSTRAWIAQPTPRAGGQPTSLSQQLLAAPSMALLPLARPRRLSVTRWYRSREIVAKDLGRNMFNSMVVVSIHLLVD